jgi:glucose/arabinose dehydrogenase
MLHRLIVPAALAAFLSVPSAIAKDGACTAEDGWSDCPAIAIKLEPIELGGEEVKANTPTALIYSAIEEGGTTQLIVADKDGDVIAYDTKTGAQRTLLSIPDISSINPERGLLGFALHPEFTTDAQKRRFYTYHTIPRSPEANANCKRLPPKPSPQKLAQLCGVAEKYGCGGSLVVTEWTVTDLTAPSKSLVPRVLLTRLQPGEGHNAGHVLFGPDGMLYISVGDGGAQQDPCSRGQDARKVTSTILRLNVNSDDITPADNPYVGMDDHDALIWAHGFRNPWRMDFVPAGQPGAGALLVGDTGQARLEEVDVIVRGGNYGWSVREGTLDHPHDGEAKGTYVSPLFEYGNPKGPTGDAGGYAVVGGVVHAGEGVLSGHYVFGDNVTMKLYALDLSASNLTDAATWTGAAKVHHLKGGTLPVGTFGRDVDGSVIVGASDGRIRKVVAE